MPIEILGISIQKYTELLRRGEGHFLDFKSKNIAAARLTRSLSAFGNADGGELYLGIEDGTEPVRSRWVGFASVENANGFIQTFEEFFPLGRYFRYEFLRCDPLPGLVLHCERENPGHPLGKRWQRLSSSWRTKFAAEYRGKNYSLAVEQKDYLL